MVTVIFHVTLTVHSSNLGHLLSGDKDPIRERHCVLLTSFREMSEIHYFSFRDTKDDQPKGSIIVERGAVNVIIQPTTSYAVYNKKLDQVILQAVKDSLSLRKIKEKVVSQGKQPAQPESLLGNIFVHDFAANFYISELEKNPEQAGNKVPSRNSLTS